MAVRKAPIVRRDTKPVNRDVQLQPPVGTPRVVIAYEPSPLAKDRLAELFLELLDERAKSGAG